MAATARRRSPKHPRTRTLPKTWDVELEEKINLILKISAQVGPSEKRFEVTKAIMMSVHQAISREFDALSKSYAEHIMSGCEAAHPSGGDRHGE